MAPQRWPRMSSRARVRSVWRKTKPSSWRRRGRPLRPLRAGEGVSAPPPGTSSTASPSLRALHQAEYTLWANSKPSTLDPLTRVTTWPKVTDCGPFCHRLMAPSIALRRDNVVERRCRRQWMAAMTAYRATSDRQQRSRRMAVLRKGAGRARMFALLAVVASISAACTAPATPADAGQPPPTEDAGQPPHLRGRGTAPASRNDGHLRQGPVRGAQPDARTHGVRG